MNLIKEGVTRDDWRGGVIVDLGFDDLMTDQVRAIDPLPLARSLIWRIVLTSGDRRSRPCRHS